MFSRCGQHSRRLLYIAAGVAARWFGSDKLAATARYRGLPGAKAHTRSSSLWNRRYTRKGGRSVMVHPVPPGPEPDPVPPEPDPHPQPPQPDPFPKPKPPPDPPTPPPSQHRPTRQPAPAAADRHRDPAGPSARRVSPADCHEPCRLAKTHRPLPGPVERVSPPRGSSPVIPRPTRRTMRRTRRPWGRHSPRPDVRPRTRTTSQAPMVPCTVRSTQPGLSAPPTNSNAAW